MTFSKTPSMTGNRFTTIWPSSVWTTLVSLRRTFTTCLWTTRHQRASQIGRRRRWRRPRGRSRPRRSSRSGRGPSASSTWFTVASTSAAWTSGSLARWRSARRSGRYPARCRAATTSSSRGSRLRHVRKKNRPTATLRVRPYRADAGLAGAGAPGPATGRGAGTGWAGAASAGAGWASTLAGAASATPGAATVSAGAASATPGAATVSAGAVCATSGSAWVDASCVTSASSLMASPLLARPT